MLNAEPHRIFEILDKTGAAILVFPTPSGWRAEAQERGGVEGPFGEGLKVSEALNALAVALTDAPPSSTPTAAPISFVTHHAFAAVVVQYGYDRKALLAKDAHKSVAAARHVVCWLLHRAGLSYPEIGRQLGRDHTTVLSSYRHVERRRRGELEYRRETSRLLRAVIPQAMWEIEGCLEAPSPAPALSHEPAPSPEPRLEAAR